MLPLSEELHDVAHKVRACIECGNLDIANQCNLQRFRRDRSHLRSGRCWRSLGNGTGSSLRRALSYVLGGTLSALDGRGPEDLYIDRLST